MGTEDAPTPSHVFRKLDPPFGGFRLEIFKDTLADLAQSMGSDQDNRDKNGDEDHWKRWLAALGDLLFG